MIRLGKGLAIKYICNSNRERIFITIPKIQRAIYLACPAIHRLLKWRFTFSLYSQHPFHILTSVITQNDSEKLFNPIGHDNSHQILFHLWWDLNEIIPLQVSPPVYYHFLVVIIQALLQQPCNEFEKNSTYEFSISYTTWYRQSSNIIDITFFMPSHRSQFF